MDKSFSLYIYVFVVEVNSSLNARKILPLDTYLKIYTKFNYFKKMLLWKMYSFYDIFFLGNLLFIYIFNNLSKQLTYHLGFHL